MGYRVHEFDTEQQAIDKVAMIDELMGFPNGGDTQTIAVPFEHNGKWYIAADVEYSHMIGEPIEITIE